MTGCYKKGQKMMGGTSGVSFKLDVFLICFFLTVLSTIQLGKLLLTKSCLNLLIPCENWFIFVLYLVYLTPVLYRIGYRLLQLRHSLGFV